MNIVIRLVSRNKPDFMLFVFGVGVGSLDLAIVLRLSRSNHVIFRRCPTWSWSANLVFVSPALCCQRLLWETQQRRNSVSPAVSPEIQTEGYKRRRALQLGDSFQVGAPACLYLRGSVSPGLGLAYWMNVSTTWMYCCTWSMTCRVMS